MTKAKSKRLTPDKAYKLIMECYQSGLTNKQWLDENGICQATFYKWVKKLRESACYNFPPDNRGRGMPSVPVRQEVVRVDVICDSIQKPKEITPYKMAEVQDITTPPVPATQNNHSPIVIQLSGANILINGYTDQDMLTNAIRSLREALC